MKRSIVLVLVSMAGGVAAAHGAGAAPPPVSGDGLAPFVAACDDLSQRAADIAAKARDAKLAAWTKKDLAKAAPIQASDKPDPEAAAMALKSDVAQAWWLDGGHTASLIYQEANGPGGQRWRSCVVTAHVADAAGALKTLLAPQMKLGSPDAFTDLPGKKLAITFAMGKGAPAGSRPGALMAEFDKPLPFPDMTFVLMKQDPQWAPHTPHPIAVTEAELYQAAAQPGTVAFRRESPVAK